MKKIKIRLFLFYMVLAVSFFAVACKASVSEDPAEEEQQTETETAEGQSQPATFTVNYTTQFGVLPDSLKDGITVNKNTILTAEQLPTLTDENAVFKGWYDGQTKAVAGVYKVTKNVTLNALWSDEVTVTYSSIFGQAPQSFNAKLKSKLTAQQLADFECAPYTFEGWCYSKDQKGNGTGDLAAVDDLLTTDITLYAKWKTATVSFSTWKGTSPSPIIKYSGETILQSEIPAMQETGYTFDGWFDPYSSSIEDYQVTDDIYFLAYWTANSYVVTFYGNGGEGNYRTQTFYYDTPQSLIYGSNTFTRTGYTFAGWANSPFATQPDYEAGDNFSTPAYDSYLYAVWTPRNDTVYKVKHYQQNANNNGYTLIETENCTGTTDTDTTATAKTYQHFTALSFDQQNINRYGYTEIEIYYNRQIITFTFDLAGGTLQGDNGPIVISGKYGQTVSIVDPSRTQYAFAGWKKSSGEGLPQTFDENATYTAQWSFVGGISVTASETDIEVQKTINGKIINFSVEACDSYNWMLDDVEIGTGQTCQIDTTNMVKGTYTLALEVQKNGRWYSYFAQIKVTK